MTLPRCLLLFVVSMSFGVEVRLFANRPDMVIFLSDDHTCRDSSVYGSKEMPTPNMARLAAAGMTFDQAFVASPSCAPSRAALLTGTYPQHNGAEANHAKPHADMRKLPAYLQALGYEVVSFGKVGHYRQTPDYGFDLAKHFNYHEDIAIAEAAKWLSERSDDRPLCLFVGTNWPHVPWPDDPEGIDAERIVPPPKHVDTKVGRQWRVRYAAAVRQMDDDLGLIYDTAQACLGDDVFFLHTSDHGAQWPFEKWNLYDTGCKTPLIVTWPGRIQRGVRSDALVSWIDILPTLIDVAAGPQPNEIDGKSFLPVLMGNATKHREYVFQAHSGDGNFNVYPSRCVRSADGWKYIRNLHPEFRFESHATAYRNDGSYWDSWVDHAVDDASARKKIQAYQRRPSEELYHVAVDPEEQSNLAEQSNHKDRLIVLRGQLDSFMQRVGDTQTTFGRPRRFAPTDAPNIVTLLIDDMGFSDLSCFDGNAVETEHLDRLASEGIRFTQFYVNSPICSPSRTALTTGQYPQRWRIGSFLNHRKSNANRGCANWLNPNAPVLARELHHAGYFTGHFGKWHMGGQRDVGNAPLINKYGFDRSLTNFEGLGPRVLGFKDAYDGKPPELHALRSDTLPTGPIERMDRSQITSRFVEAALQHIDRAQAQGQPFLINLWPDDVHSPFFPPRVLREGTDESKRQLYYAVLDAMDQQLAPLIDRIRNDDRLRDNTLIVMCSDNGHEPGAGRSDPFRGNKTLLYEGGIRSPLIVWGPGFVSSDQVGTVNETSVFSAIDLNRSLYSLAEIPLPEGHVLDGEDVMATLLGKSTVSRQSPICFRRPPDRPNQAWGFRGRTDLEIDAPDLAIRHEQWKLLMNIDGSGLELYDLSQDPSESINLATSHPSVVETLRDHLIRWNETLPKDACDPTFRVKTN
ncbi:MAG: sulfatase-like hydrolase/transferase [Planctomycetota bacterium]